MIDEITIDAIGKCKWEKLQQINFKCFAISENLVNNLSLSYWPKIRGVGLSILFNIEDI